MRPKGIVALTLIASMSLSSTAQALAVGLPPELGDFHEMAESPETLEMAPAKQRLLRPLLRKVLESEAFQGEEGTKRIHEIIERATELTRVKALNNIARMSEEQLRKQILRSAKRAKKDGNKGLEQYFRTLAESSDGSLKEKLLDLHAPERVKAFTQKLHDSIDKAGSAQKALELLDHCWDYAPLSTEFVIAVIVISWLIMIQVPWLAIGAIPVMLIFCALLPFALLIDYVVIFPFYLFIEIIPCELGYP